MSRSARVSSFLASTLAVTLLCGCAGWHSIGKEPPAQYLAREKPRTVRVSLAESTFVLSGPAMREDSVVGFAREGTPVRPVAVPITDIRKLEVRSLKGSTTGKVVVGTFWGMGLAMLVLFAIHPGARTNP